MHYQGVVFDLDGTIYRGNHLLPGAAGAVRRVREAGASVLFFSNNPSRSREAYATKLEDLGIEVTPDEVLSAGTVTTRFLATEHPEDSVFVVGATGLLQQFKAAELKIVAEPERATVLVASYDPDFDYVDMRDGYRALAAGAIFYGTDPDRLVPATDGMVPGSGAIINAIGGIVDQSPRKILGKPSAEAQIAALEALECPPDRCLLVGDRLNTDIALGENAGMTTVLVETGVASSPDIDDGGIIPDYVLSSLESFDEIFD